MNAARRAPVLLFGILLVAGVAVLSLPGMPAAARNEVISGEVLAVVNGDEVTRGDYKKFLMKVDPSLEARTVDSALLHRLIEERLIIQEARKRGITVSDAEVEQSIRDFISTRKISYREFEKTITDKGMTVEEYKKWLKENIIVLSKMIYSEIDSTIRITDKEVADYYSRNRGLFVATPEELTVGAVIMAMSENPSAEEITDMKMKSLRIVADLRKGASFEKMVSEYSDDKSREHGGIIGVFKPGQLVPDLEKALSTLRPGEYSNPVWTRQGVYILRLVRRVPAAYLPARTVQDAIRRTLTNEKKGSAYKQWVRSLWEKAAINIH
ncbi:MAG: peptidylprolyl isomerase [Nitrospiraceae bacterium]|nr:peptidylprolyl isomerase [Nitrospiraceae bacterium]